MASDFLERLRQKKGAAAVSALQDIMSDAELRAYIAIDTVEASPMDVPTAIKSLSDFLLVKPVLSLLPTIFTAITLSMRGTIQLVARKAEDLPNGHSDAGFVEAIQALLGFKLKHAFKSTLITLDPVAIQAALDRYVPLHALLGVLTSFVTILKGDLRVQQDYLYKLVKDQYDLVRKAVQADPDLARELAPTENYYYGPAKEAADQAKENRIKETQMQDRVEQKLRPTLEKAVRSELMAEFKEMVDSLNQPAPTSPAPTTTSTPASAANKAPTPTSHKK